MKVFILNKIWQGVIARQAHSLGDVLHVANGCILFFKGHVTDNDCDVLLFQVVLSLVGKMASECACIDAWHLLSWRRKMMLL
jgi:hypothetical protein